MLHVTQEFWFHKKVNFGKKTYKKKTHNKIFFFEHKALFGAYILTDFKHLRFFKPLIRKTCKFENLKSINNSYKECLNQN